MSETRLPRAEWITVLAVTAALALAGWLGTALLGVIGLGQGLGQVGALVGGHDKMGESLLGQLDIRRCTRLFAAAQVVVSGLAGWRLGPAERAGKRAALGLIGGLIVGPGGLMALDALLSDPADP